LKVDKFTKMPKGLPPVFPSRRPSSVVRYLLAIFLVLTILYALNNRVPIVKTAISSPGFSPGHESEPRPLVDEQPPPTDAHTGSSSDPDDGHPIGKLIYDAQHVFAELMSKESRSIEDAAQAYRKRRGRHPPPGFEKWYTFARSKNSIIVEDFFDQIYSDIEPFWGMDPTTLRKESWDFEMTINIRNGKATAGSDWFWTVIWLDLIQTIEHLLPDMDLPLNAMDEPRLVVPWEDIQNYMKKAAKTKKLPKAKTVLSDYQRLPEPGKGDITTWTRPKKWEDTRKFAADHLGGVCF
jgi:hypothetical protein